MDAVCHTSVGNDDSHNDTRGFNDSKDDRDIIGDDCCRRTGCATSPACGGSRESGNTDAWLADLEQRACRSRERLRRSYELSASEAAAVAAAARTGASSAGRSSVSSSTRRLSTGSAGSNSRGDADTTLGGEEHAPVLLLIECEDSGCGIAEEDWELVFHAFTRVRNGGWE